MKYIKIKDMTMDEKIDDMSLLMFWIFIIIPISTISIHYLLWNIHF